LFHYPTYPFNPTILMIIISGWTQAMLAPIENGAKALMRLLKPPVSEAGDIARSPIPLENAARGITNRSSRKRSPSQGW
jgi:hypothetical protein